MCNIAHCNGHMYYVMYHVLSYHVCEHVYSSPFVLVFLSYC